MEFVGLHAYAKNGIVQADVPIIPMVKRGFAKIGKKVQAGGRTDGEQKAIDAMRLIAIGDMFCGKIPAIAKVFQACARKSMYQLTNPGNKGADIDAATRLWSHNEYSAVGQNVRGWEL